MAFVEVGHEHGSLNTRTSEPRLLHGYFERQVRRTPYSPAIECADGTLTYLELDAYSNQVAHALRQRGVSTGHLVGILMEKSPRLFAAILGVLKAGAAYVPLSPRFPVERVTAILDDCDATLVISDAAAWGAFQDSTQRPALLLDIHANVVAQQPTTSLSAADLGLDSSHLCYVIYTSGSTGKPKGVMVEHRNVAAFIEGMCDTYEINARDRIYQGFSVAFDASVEEIWAAFATGATLVVPSEDVARSPADVAEFIDSNGVTYFSTIPTFLSMIDAELSTVRILVLGGEACSAELVRRWSKPWRRMLNTYGPSETTVVATIAECHLGEPVTIGRALPGYRAYVLDDNLNRVSEGEAGELYVGGAAVTRGYMNAPELTKERFIRSPFSNQRDRLYRTGDQVKLLKSGELEFVGRLDGQIKIRGFRVELAEIESALLQQPSIRAAAVSVITTGQGMELAAFVVAENSRDLDRTAIAAKMRQRLPEYMVPKYLDVVDRLPLSSSGKIDRKALPSPTTLLKREASDVEMPADELERLIANAWQIAVCGPVSATDDFFLDLGGHSLLAAQAVSLLRKSISPSHISVRDIYRHRTVRNLAAALRARGVGVSVDDTANQVDETAPTASEIAFASVSRLTRYSVAFLQAVSILVLYGIASAPIAYMVLMVLAVLDQRVAWTDAAWISTIVGFSAWPSMLALSIAVKWLVIGRYKPGRYPVWGSYYFRWWLVTRFQALAWSEMFNGTPLMSLYYRAMGARIGKRVTISTPHCRAFDVVSVGDDSSIGLETHLLGCRIEDGMLVIAPVSIGRDCFVGMHCNLGLDAGLMDGARLEDMSSLDDGISLAEGEMRRGAPAQPALIVVPEAPEDRRRRRSFIFGMLHLALIYAMGYFLLATAAPAIAAIAAGLYFGGPWYGVAAAFGAVPLSILSYMLGVVVLKRCFVGRLRTQSGRLDSFAYLRHWFSTYLLENTRHILMPLYATIYLPPFLRLLGARIGKGTEISTVAYICPDHLEIGDGSFLADACLVGGTRVHGGRFATGAVRIGERSFVGNSALVAAGAQIGSNALVGVASTPPIGGNIPAGTSWLGSPGFELPRTQKDCCFPEAVIFTPSLRMRLQRALIDLARILTPGLIVMGMLVGLTISLVYAWYHLPLWATLAMVPFVDMVLSCVALGIVVLLKQICLGTMGPTVRPLWSRFVWANEFINGVYEGVAAAIITPLMGTHYIAPCLRLMGCKIGRRAFIETTLFSEFDLVNIGSYAALNLGATVQTHLFEDRIFKADTLHIGKGCSVGNMALVLYGTEMHEGASLAPLSVLMKGEQLPAGTRWSGIPCEEAAAQLRQTPSSPLSEAHGATLRAA